MSNENDFDLGLLDQAGAEKIAAPEEVTESPAGDNADMRSSRRLLDAQKKVDILIPATETEKDDVFVGVNGIGYQIKRGASVPVPESVVRVLEDAKITMYVQVKRDDGEGNELRSVEAQRIPFQVAR